MTHATEAQSTPRALRDIDRQEVADATRNLVHMRQDLSTLKNARIHLIFSRDERASDALFEDASNLLQSVGEEDLRVAEKWSQSKLLVFGRKRARVAAHRVLELDRVLAQGQFSQRIESALIRVREQSDRERDDLGRLLDSLPEPPVFESLREAARTALGLAAKLPLSKQGIEPDERAFFRDLAADETFTRDFESAVDLLRHPCDGKRDCDSAHQSVELLAVRAQIPVNVEALQELASVLQVKLVVERQQLADALSCIDEWAELVGVVRFRTKHLPEGALSDLPAASESLLQRVIAVCESGDLALARHALEDPNADGRREAAHRVVEFAAEFEASCSADALRKLHRAVVEESDSSWARFHAALKQALSVGAFAQLVTVAKDTLTAANALPLTDGVLSQAEENVLEVIGRGDDYGRTLDLAWQLASEPLCESRDDCGVHHRAADRLLNHFQDTSRFDVLEIYSRVEESLRDYKQRLSTAADVIDDSVEKVEELVLLSARMPLSGPVELEGIDPKFVEALQQKSLTEDLQQARKAAGADSREPATAGARRILSANEKLTTRFQESLARLDPTLQLLRSRWEDEHDQLAEAVDVGANLRSVCTAAYEYSTHMPISISQVFNDGDVEAVNRYRVPQFSKDLAAAEELKSDAYEFSRLSSLRAAALRLISAVETDDRAKAEQVSARIARNYSHELEELLEAQYQLAALSQKISSLGRKWSEASDAVASALRTAHSGKKNAVWQGGTHSFYLVPTSRFFSHLNLLIDYENAGFKKVENTVRHLAQVFNDGMGNIYTKKMTCRKKSKCRPFHESAGGWVQDIYKLIDVVQSSDFCKVRSRNGATSLRMSKSILLDGLNLHDVELNIVPKKVLKEREGSIAFATDCKQTIASAEERVRSLATGVRERGIKDMMREMPLDVLRKSTEEGSRIRLKALEDAGLSNVLDIYEDRLWLSEIRGMGEASARTAERAARAIHDGLKESTSLRIDIQARSDQTSDMLIAISMLIALKSIKFSDEQVAASEIAFNLLKDEADFSYILEASPVGTEPMLGANNLPDVELVPTLYDRESVWEAFLLEPAEYYSALNDLGFETEDAEKMHGDLTEEIIEAVRKVTLKRNHLTASLRNYQVFGAKFVLAQRKVIIGDDMGLGKTVEALAALTHLRAQGQTHFLIVCPASVVSNWMREIEKHTKLHPYRLHGPMQERSHNLRRWKLKGGIAVVTYDLLAWVTTAAGDLSCRAAVFDEAHYIKNPVAKRSVASAAIIGTLDHVILLTGTPLENNLGEFRTLLNYIRPDLAGTMPEYFSGVFKSHVAPAYLRRNQEDVLTELPKRVDSEDWVALSKSDSDQYRDAVHGKNFMKMRQIGFAGTHPSKLERLGEILAEAKENHHKSVVFSFFLETLNSISTLIGGRVFGPITGRTPAAKRQMIVDAFSEAEPGAVLVAQIGAAGVGLNIQAASIVVLCEPQLKPTIEEQAIARAHRMGQTKSVQVHRILAEGAADARILEILANKRQIFDEFVRASEIAEGAVEATDVSQSELAKQVVAEEVKRLFGPGESTRA